MPKEQLKWTRLEEGKNSQAFVIFKLRLLYSSSQIYLFRFLSFLNFSFLPWQIYI